MYSLFDLCAIYYLLQFKVSSMVPFVPYIHYHKSNFNSSILCILIRLEHHRMY